MNWMRIAALPDFRKLWGRILVDIPAGSYRVDITNRNFSFKLFVVYNLTAVKG